MIYWYGVHPYTGEPFHRVVFFYCIVGTNVSISLNGRLVDCFLTQERIILRSDHVVLNAVLTPATTDYILITDLNVSLVMLDRVIAALVFYRLRLIYKMQCRPIMCT